MVFYTLLSPSAIVESMMKLTYVSMVILGDQENLTTESWGLPIILALGGGKTGEFLWLLASVDYTVRLYS